MPNKSIRHLVLSTISLAFITGQTIQAAPYDLIDLGTLEGVTTFSYAINSLNEVTGNSDGANIATVDIDLNNPPVTCNDGGALAARLFCTRAFLYSNGDMTDLGDLGNFHSYAFGINDSSTVVGYSIEPVLDIDGISIGNRDRATISFNGAAVQPIPYPVDHNLDASIEPSQRALGISNTGIVVGFTLVRLTAVDGTSASVNRPYSYDQALDITSLVPVFADEVNRSGTARSINDAGLIVGWANSEDENNPPHALLWDPASPALSVDLGTLGGFTSEAWDINNNGIIVGASETTLVFATNERLGFVYDPNAATPMIAIPEFSDLDNINFSTAYAINNNNLVVGTAEFNTTVINASTAFLYDYNQDILVNLNDMVDCSLNWELYTARDINDNGYITGTGIINDEVHSYLLIPTADTTPTNCTALRAADRKAVKDAIVDSAAGSFGLLTLFFGGLFIYRRRVIIK